MHFAGFKTSSVGGQIIARYFGCFCNADNTWYRKQRTAGIIKALFTSLLPGFYAYKLVTCKTLVFGLHKAHLAFDNDDTGNKNTETIKWKQSMVPFLARKVYYLSDIQEIVLETEGKMPKCLRVITKDFRNKLARQILSEMQPVCSIRSNWKRTGSK